MAGSYDDAPSRRMAWDADGTVGLWAQDDAASVDWSAGDQALLNDENGADINGITTEGATGYLVNLFPELRELDGYFATKSVSGYTTVQTSPDTTNGIDGTWTTRIANLAPGTVVSPNFRDDITSLAVPTIKGVRLRKNDHLGSFDHIFRAIHLYGTISAGETPDRILFLDTEDSDAEFTKVLDFGDLSRGQTTTRTFKIKNNSSSKTINTIQVTAEDLYLNAGDWYTFGDDGVAYQATYAVGNLGPGSTKLIYLKQIIPDAETLGLHTGRILVSHDSVT